MSSDSVLRWGIIGCGNISNDFSLSVYRLHSPRHKLLAAASRSSVKSAEEFAKRFKMPKWYGSYEELFADPEINAVYIGNLHPDHQKAALAAIDAGKAVLVEKPMTMNETDTRCVLEASRAKGVLLMEAVWSRFNPIYCRLRQLTTGPDAHKPAVVMANFTDVIGGRDRMSKPELGGGAMLDIGIYPLQLATMVFGGKMPTKIYATGHANELGVDLGETVALEYEGGGHASLVSDARCGCPAACEARIFFFSGGQFLSAKICPPFWTPEKLELTKTDGSIVVEEYPIYPNLDTNDGLKFNYTKSQGLAYEAEGFADAFEKWQKTRNNPQTAVIEHPYRSHNDTLVDAYVMDAVMAQVKSKK